MKNVMIIFCTYYFDIILCGHVHCLHMNNEPRWVYKKQQAAKFKVAWAVDPDSSKSIESPTQIGDPFEVVVDHVTSERMSH